MSLPAIFSLIFASLLGLLPIFLLVSRRAIASRLSRRREHGRGESTSETAAKELDSARPGHPQIGLGVSGSGDPAGESAILDRLIRERRAAAEPKRKSARDRIAAAQRESVRLGRASDHSVERESRIEARLGRLSVLQRAVVYREILGRPIGLRAPGEPEDS